MSEPAYVFADYEFQFRKCTLSTQVNINNIFNHDHVLLVPNNTT